jgi:hypothetical protein
MAIFSLTDSVVTSQDIVHHTLGEQDDISLFAILSQNCFTIFLHGTTRREIIAVRGQSYVFRLPKY